MFDKIDKNKLKVFAAAVVATVITWYIQHEMGYSAIISNGVVGVLAAIFLPGPLAGAAYAASFVGMSSSAVLPSIGAAGLAGVVVGITLMYTAEVFAGIGGKGGTTAAFAVQVSRFILNLFV